MSSSFTSYYGIFDTDMKPVDIINVSDKIATLIQHNTLQLPKEQSLDDLFPNHFTGTKFLQLQFSDSRKINILNDTYDHDLAIHLARSSKPISVVYSVFIHPGSNWQVIISGQLLDIKSYGLLDEADLYIHVTNVHRIAGVLAFIEKETEQKAIISQSFTNQFEYPALKLLHQLSKQNPEKVYMYFHTKGISRSIQQRHTDERILLENTFKHWRKNIQAFDDPTINKIGLFPALQAPNWGGWVWYNFFIVRGNYLTECDDLLPVFDDRHYYESWLSRNKGVISVNDCYSLFTNRKENFSQQATSACMNTLTAQSTGKSKQRKISLRLRYPFIKIRR